MSDLSSPTSVVPRPSIRVQGAVKSFGGRVVVDVDDMTLGTYPIEGLIGPNGAGKTTLMRMIMQSVRVDRGVITFVEPRSGGARAQVLTGLQPHQVAALGVVKTNQIIQDFEPLTVSDSLLLAVAKRADERPHRLYRERRLWRERADEIRGLAERFGLGRLSGFAKSAGDKKILDIARCLLLKPKVLLLDEPMAGLALDARETVIEFIRELAHHSGVSVVIVEHDLNVIWQLSDFVHFMAEGRVLLQGAPEEIRQHEIVVQKYVGGGHV